MIFKDNDLFGSLNVGECIDVLLDIDEYKGTDASILACRTDKETIKMKTERTVNGQKISKDFLIIQRRKMNDDDF
jgi:hypothetical protein